LVEHRALAAPALADMVLATALLQPLEHLALACGDGKRLAAGFHLGVTAVELERARLAVALRLLEVSLCGHEVVARGGTAREGLDALRARAFELVDRGAQHRLALEAMDHRGGKLFLGLLLDALAHGAHPLEAEVEGTVLHGPVG